MRHVLLHSSSELEPEQCAAERCISHYEVLAEYTRTHRSLVWAPNFQGIEASEASVTSGKAWHSTLGGALLPLSRRARLCWWQQSAAGCVTAEG